MAAVLAALTEREAAMRGLARVESMLILLLLFETLVHRKTRHLPIEVPTVGDVIAGCVRLAVRLVVLIVVADAVVLERARPHDAGGMGAARPRDEGRGDLGLRRLRAAGGS